MSREREFAAMIGTASHRGNYAGEVAQAYPPPTAMDTKNLIEAMAAIKGDFRWADRGDKFHAAPDTAEELPAGAYTGTMTDQGPMLLRKPLVTDGLLALPDPISDAVLAEFDLFWTRRELFKKHGFLHKRGLLLWGPPGSGKSSSLQMMMAKIIDKGGVVFIVDHPAAGTLCLALLRKIEPNRPVVVVMEDIDAIVQRYGESELLALLDGESQIDNVCMLGTTNYPERLDKRFVDRPSRFDSIMYFGMPSDAARAAYFTAKDAELATDAGELSKWVRLSEGFSVAHLREMIVAVRCLGQSLESVVERLESMHERHPTSEKIPDAPNFGFPMMNGLNGRHA